MKQFCWTALVVLAAGCSSGPRVYDGVIGYRTAQLPAGVGVTYIDELRVKREKTVAKIAAVCVEQNKGKPGIQILSESEYATDVMISVPVPVGSTPTGDIKSGSDHGAAAVMRQTTQGEQFTRKLKVRKIEAICAAGSP